MLQFSSACFDVVIHVGVAVVVLVVANVVVICVVVLID